MATTPKCENCRFAEMQYQQPGGDRRPFALCRRYAPKPDGVEPSLWPRVHAQLDWCGEFQDRARDWTKSAV